MRRLTPLKNCTENATSELDLSCTKVNILMVDDHPENLLALEAVLMSPHYNLVKATSGEEALRRVLKDEFAVILLDVQMPGLNGFETAKLIKARERSRHIPILFITALSQATEHVHHGYSVGAIDYIFKPFHKETLQLKIEGFVQIYRNQKRLQQKRELLLKRSAELEQANEQLRSTTADLRKAEALARAIGETSLDTILTLDHAGSILTANPALVRMFGLTQQDVKGRPVTLLLPTFQLVRHREGGANWLESEALRKDGSCFPVEIQIGEASVEDQQVFVCTIRDITERKQLEAERKQQYEQLEELVEARTLELAEINDDLRQSKERFRKIFQSSPSLMSIHSLKTRQYLDTNESFRLLTGYAQAEVINREADLIQIAFLETCNSGSPLRNAPITYVTKSGEVRQGLLSTEILEIQGESCVLSVITDITERAHLEREMGRLDRLNLIGEMAAGIAHEIRNPMTTVRGFLQLTRSKQNVPETAYIDLMVHELDRANAIITEFLTLAKNKTTDRKWQDLNAIINALFPLIQAEAILSDKHILLELGELQHLYLDEKEIRQLILNLALNGLEAMEPGRQLTVRTWQEQQHAVLEIRDQGCGIKGEMLEKIGTPFFTTKEKGTGLGLAVCYSVAARHLATIDLKTSEQGTTFFVRFPMKPAH